MHQFTVDGLSTIRFCKSLEAALLSNRHSVDTSDVFSFFRKEQAPYFISTPSSPLYPVENDNITLQWTYSLDGALLDEVELYFAADSPSRPVQRVARYWSGGTTQVANDFQDRSVFSLTDSQSTVIIQYSQRSDSGEYKLIVTPDDVNLAAFEDKVKISVKCKYKVFPYFLVATSTIIIMIIIMNMRAMIFT